ncbi:hypothetical protein WR06_03410 [Escherichia coli]|nr:DUF551 domain-containing protein [Escherichia coli]EEW0537663.1 DUF551 domain-containing protein [Escherichia coli]EEZ4451780.1 DUF551 domain-containing protein [Escherichia coli]EEZ5820930.1 DUF551 domain-containing protein [Escherichia coli]EFI2815016.1 DUF551 domain-containing protein [Escherichia coli]
MSAIPKERIELFIKNPLDNELTRGEQMELARIALTSLEAEPVAYIFKHPAGKLFWALTDESNKEQADVIPVYAAAPASVVPDNASEPLAYAYKELTPEIMRNHLAVFERYGIAPNDSSTTIQALRIALDGIERSDAMLHGAEPVSQTYKLNELAGNSPVIPGEVLSAILKVARVRADFDDFDGDRRGIGDCLDEAEQELIVTINKYASQLAAEPIAPNDVREQTAIPQVPVTPDGWISCSERMPEMGERQCYVLAADFKNNYPPNIPNTQVGVYGDWFNDGNPTWDDGDGEDLYLKEVTHWMPLPEPPQEVK